MRTLGARASSPSETAAVAASDENTENTRLPTPRSPTVRDPQIPIVALEKQPQPPRGFLLGRLSSAGPSACSTVRKRAGARNPSPLLPFKFVPMKGRNAQGAGVRRGPCERDMSAPFLPFRPGMGRERQERVIRVRCLANELIRQRRLRCLPFPVLSGWLRQIDPNDIKNGPAGGDGNQLLSLSLPGDSGCK